MNLRDRATKPWTPTVPSVTDAAPGGMPCLRHSTAAEAVPCLATQRCRDSGGPNPQPWRCSTYPQACLLDVSTWLIPLPGPLSLRHLAGRLPHMVITAVNSLSSASVYPPDKCYRLQGNAHTSMLVCRSTNLYFWLHFIPCCTSICSI